MAARKPRRVDFSLESYSDTLRAYKEDGYAVTSFQDYLADPQPKHMVLRHDIEHDIEQALRVARIDAAEGCTSTTFLRVNSRGYNLLSLPTMLAMREMEDLGLEVQLHLEGGLGEWLGGDDWEWADRQRAAFEAAAGRPLGGFSPHEPARMGGVAFANGLLERWSDSVLYHAYEERFFTPQMKYLSDSGARWREGHFGEWIGKEQLLQVLVHPWWWFERTPAENY